MAGCERRYYFCKIFILFQLFQIVFAIYSPKFRDFLPSVLERHIKVSRHLPVCIVYRKPGEGSELENVVHDLWRGVDKKKFTSWEFGSYAYGENTKLHYRKISDVPFLRCFLGYTSLHDYTGKPDRYKIDSWLGDLAKTLEDQLQDATEDLVNAAIQKYNFTIVAFPDHTRHSEIEEMAFQVTEVNKNCKAYISHMHSLDNRKIRDKYKIYEIPSVIIIYRIDSSKTVRAFYKQQMAFIAMDVFVKARSLTVPHFTFTTFERDVIKTSKTCEEYTPLMITFYTYWATGIYGYLSMLGRSIEEFRDLNLYLYIGLVDLNDDSSQTRKIISRYISSTVAQKLPFTLLFYKDSNGTTQQLHFTGNRPTSMSLYTWLSAHDVVANSTNLPLIYLPYGIEDTSLFTLSNEGPFGNLCYITSHNETDSTPVELKWTKKNPQRVKKEKKKQKAWHDVFGTESINKKLQKLEDICMLTGQFWSEVIEKSHAPQHPFLPGREWAGEVTKVALVIFIMADCRSCKNGMETFKQLQNSVKYIAGGSVYLVNCTEEAELCREHDIRGYPTVTAFRGLGWLESSTCISDDSQKLYKSYTRMDYHGVLQPKQIMVWFGEVASTAVKDRLFDWPKEKLEEDVRLIGVLVPKGSRFLPLPPRRIQNYYFSYECFRLVCERLFSKATCYSVYSKEIPQKDFTKQDLDVIVSKIIIQRQDSVEATVMQIGHTLSQSLESQSDSKLHMFHRAHRYKLRPGQRCEDDHPACTDIITAFTIDHARLPVTKVTSNAFHTTDSLNDEDLPILIALVYKDNMTDYSPFSQVLTQIAYQFYNDLIVVTLDVEEYPAWTGKFVPREYTKQVIKYDGDPKSMYEYPRMCIVKKNDHNNAVFYPGLDQDRLSTDWFVTHKLQQFLLDYFDNPTQQLTPTEHF